MLVGEGWVSFTDVRRVTAAYIDWYIQDTFTIGDSLKLSYNQVFADNQTYLLEPTYFPDNKLGPQSRTPRRPRASVNLSLMPCTFECRERACTGRFFDANDPEVSRTVASGS